MTSKEPEKSSLLINELFDILITKDVVSFEAFINQAENFTQELNLKNTNGRHFNVAEICVNLGSLDMVKILQ